MTGQPTVGLALIARNEETQLPRLLASLGDAFDQVVLVDTGSTDNTIKIFKDWAYNHHGWRELDDAFVPPIDNGAPNVIAHFDWCEDFAAARNYAESLLTTDWHSWADCDDEIRNPAALRQLAAGAAPEISAFVFDYAYGHDQHGNMNCRLKRERLVRAGKATWAGRIHEAQLIDGNAVFVAPDVAVWVHHPAVEGRDPDRNLRILQRWVDEDPANPRVLAYMGTETLARGQIEDATGYLRRYLELDPGWDEERAQVHRKLSQALIAAGELAEAAASAHAALDVMPAWPDSYLSLAEVAYHRHEWRNAGDWAKRVLELGTPETLLIINPLDYLIQPKVILAGSMGALGHLDKAIIVAEEVLAVAPDHVEVAKTLQVWRGQMKREETAARVISEAQNLVAHDEQAKALVLLEQTVPYYAQDHPQVVTIRSQLRERLRFATDPAGYAEHYVTGGSKPEDFMDDERALAVGAALPRCRFLLDGLTEQLETVAA